MKDFFHFYKRLQNLTLIDNLGEKKIKLWRFYKYILTLFRSSKKSTSTIERKENNFLIRAKKSRKKLGKIFPYVKSKIRKKITSATAIW